MTECFTSGFINAFCKANVCCLMAAARPSSWFSPSSRLLSFVGVEYAPSDWRFQSSPRSPPDALGLSRR